MFVVLEITPCGVLCVDAIYTLPLLNATHTGLGVQVVTFPNAMIHLRGVLGGRGVTVGMRAVAEQA